MSLPQVSSAPQTGVVVITNDQPVVTAQYFRQLAANDAITASRYGGRRGVPAYFPANIVNALTRLKRDARAGATRDSANFALPGGKLDLDTVEAFSSSADYLRLNPLEDAKLRLVALLRGTGYSYSDNTRKKNHHHE